MLTAISQNGKLVSLCDGWTKAELEKARNNNTFFCPDCKEPLQMKLGSVKAWHFAHLRSTSCIQTFKCETDDHIQGKWFLYNWLKNQLLHPKIEKIIPDLNLRPDLMFGRNIIELQHSSIPFEQFKSRHQRYINASYNVRWLGLTTEASMPQHNIVTFSTLDGFFLSFPKEEHPLTLTSTLLNPYTGMFFKFCPQLYVSPRKTFSRITTFQSSYSYRSLFDLSKDRNPPLSKHSLQHYFQVWNTQTRKERKRPRFAQKNKAEKQVATLLYQYNLNLTMFPSLTRIPLPSQIFLDTPPQLWQTWVILAYIHTFTPGSRFSIDHLLRTFMKELHTFHLRLLPFSKQNMVQRLLLEYLDVLSLFGVVHTDNRRSFTVVSHITVRKSPDQLLRDDEYILKIVKGYWEEKWLETI
ncbi:competence protein CoiA [Alteribacter aurantiacus]|uniref:competence protein CoiA n=1 Tax=Alteribacter aurantiacus TaxID=254410 RepID=UPI000425BB71|nr:competence protein CoiA family protein [Alteribacter aurantiacus]